MPSKTAKFGPIAFAGRFFFFWNGILFATVMIGMIFPILMVNPLINTFPQLMEDGRTTSVILLGALFIASLLLAFVVSFYFFKRAYPRLAAAVSLDLPTNTPQRTLWKIWAIAYWFTPISLIAFLAFAGFSGILFTRRLLGVTAYPVLIFLTSLPVYLYLRYLARRQTLHANS